MIPILYGELEKTFTTNGIGRLTDCISAVVTEERNGIFELEFQYPITGKWYSSIKEGMIVSVIHDDRKTRQPFVIYRRSAPIDGIVTFNAHHISYNLAFCILKPFTASTIGQAFSAFEVNSITDCPFTFWTDKTSEGNFKVTVPISIKEILGGVSGSILDVFGGGEYEFDNLTVKLYQHRGKDSGVTIRYGKNMIDMEQEVDISDCYNAVAPYWTNGEVTVTIGTQVVYISGGIFLPYYLTEENNVNLTDQNGNPISLDLQIIQAVPMDLSGDFEEPPTQEQLIAKAKSRLENSEAWLPNENISIDFAALWQTEEYKYLAILQRVSLCDTVTVDYPELGIVGIKKKVIKTVYNVLTEKYDQIEIGEAKTSFADVVTAQMDDKLKDVPTTTFLQEAINHATELITGGLGGYVIMKTNASGEPEELLIMDTPDIATAVNVIRMNRNGIGFSNSGYNGQFRSAWTIDGHFVADFITAGTMLANRIHGGTLRLGGASNGNGVLELYNGSNVLVGRLDRDGAQISGNLKVDYKNCKLYVDDFTVHDYEYSGHPTQTYAGIGTQTRALKILHLDKTDSSYIRPRTYIIVDDSTSANQPYKMFFTWSSDISDYGAMLEFRPETFYLESALNYDLSLGANGIIIHDYKHTSTLSIGNNSSVTVGPDGELNIYNSGGQINGQEIELQSSSSRRYKHDIKHIEDDELDPHRLYKLEAKQFVFNDDHKTQYADMAGKKIPGFIAEDVADIYPSAVIHDNEGQIESWDERRIIPAMLSLIKEQKKQIDDLTARLERLEAFINANT